MERPKSLNVAVMLGVMTLLASLFIALTLMVSAGNHPQFDHTLLAALGSPDNPSAPLGPTWLGEMMRDGTALGSNWVLLILSMIVALYLYLCGHKRLMLFLLCTVLSGLAIAFGLKHLIARPRPDLLVQVTTVYTASFPSAHAMMSTVVYGSLALIISQFHVRAAVKWLGYISVLLVLIWVGSSRVYLGVHWPSDVLAGWCAGTFWLICTYCLMMRPFRSTLPG